MSKLTEYRQLENHLAEQLQALETLKSDGALKKETEFESELRWAPRAVLLQSETHYQSAGPAKHKVQYGLCR
jgi:hypothetical protein